MFPSPEDIRLHKAAAVRRRKKEAELTAEQAQLRSPQALGDAILRVARSEYRKGERSINFSMRLQSDNFVEWARSEGIVGDLVDDLASRLIHRSLTSLTERYVNSRLKPGVFLSFSSETPSRGIVVFTAKVSVINP